MESIENIPNGIVELDGSNAHFLAELRRKTSNKEKKTDDELLEEANEYVDNKNKKAIIFFENGVPLGFAQIKFEHHSLPQAENPEDLPNVAVLQDLGRLGRIGVVEEYGGKGIGTQLLLRAEEEIRSRGKSGIWLDYLANNERAVRLYKKNGYKDITEFIDPKKNKVRRIARKLFEMDDVA